MKRARVAHSLLWLSSNLSVLTSDVAREVIVRLALFGAIVGLASSTSAIEPPAGPAAPQAPREVRVLANRDDSDPFQRHLTFYNDTPVTIWPVFQAPQDSNCKDVLGSKLLRIHVNEGVKGAGIPPTHSVTVALPKTWPCTKGGLYDAVRIFVFTVDLPKFEVQLAAAQQNNQVTQPYSAGLATPICGKDLATDPCWTGIADAAYALDSPAQLLEYTIISQDSKGVAFPDPNDEHGVPFLDFDVSYVDEAYLPAAMTSDTGAIQFMGSKLSYQKFSEKLTAFITQTKWPDYAAYADLNFNSTQTSVVGGKTVPNRTIFADLLIENKVGQYPRVPSGAQAVENSFNGGGSAFYRPSWDGVYSKLCVDPLGKANLLCVVQLPTNELCCPDANGIQGCCDAGNFLIDKVRATYHPASKTKRFSSDVLKDLTSRFTKWNDPFDCSQGTPASPVLDQVGFCNAFKKTVRFVWKAFTAQDAVGAKTCAPLARTDQLFEECLTATIIGYRIDTTHAKDFADACKTCPVDPCPSFCTVEKQLNESVQALLRGLPWTSKGDPATCGPDVCPSSDPSKCSVARCVWTKTEETSANAKLYHFDKFLHFWAPYDSVYNLNPYARVIHDPDGLFAPGAYSFSIDDFYGNFGGPGSNLIIDVGGTSHMPNPETFDPYKQYHVTAGPGWDHFRLCGRKVDIPKDVATGRGIGLGTPFSFYLADGTRHDPCEVAVFEDAAETRFVKFQLSEVSYSVTDAYSGKPYTVLGLSGAAASRHGDGVPDDIYCTQPGHATPDLVAKGKCNANLSPVGYGNRDAYNGVVDNCGSQTDAKCGKPLINLAVPARIPF